MSYSLDSALTLFGVEHPEVQPESTLTFSVRVPINLASHIVALAENAHVSRNVMCINLLSIGLESLRQAMPPHRLKEVDEAFPATYMALRPESTEEE